MTLRHCKQCHRVLDAPSAAAAAAAATIGPALGESFVLLPTAVSPRGVRATGSFASLTQSTIHEPWESTLLQLYPAMNSQLFAPASHLAETNDVTSPPPASTTRPPPAIRTPTATPTGVSTPPAPSAAARSLAESVVAVATHADLSDNVRTLNAYHAHCSGQPVQTPACKDCVDTMLAQIDSHAERARAEKRAFGGFLQSTGSSVRNEEVDQINEKIQFYEDELKALEENLTLMEEERAELAARQQQLEKESAALGGEEAALWGELNELQFQETAFHECQGTARARLAALDAAMAATRAQNMVREVFYISQKGPFGTINGFRLGQLPTEHVEWNEINTALGESALLVVTMASLLGVAFSDFKIVPVGSLSKVIRISSVRMEYRLHGSDQDMFPESHFNLGLGAWITCIGQLLAHVEAQDRSMRFPYKVSKHTVGGKSVLYLKNKQPEWSKALRYALTDLKWLQEWAAKRIQ